MAELSVKSEKQQKNKKQERIMITKKYTPRAQLVLEAQEHGFNDLQALGDEREILGPMQFESHVRDL